MISGITPVLSNGYNGFEFTEPKIVEEVEPVRNILTEREIIPTSGLHSRILLYDSIESLDLAANSLTKSNIKHKYHVIPALTTTEIWEYEIPLEGLISVSLNTMTVRPAVETNKEIGEIYKEVNSKLNMLTRELKTDLTTIDGFMWYLSKKVRVIK